LQRFLESLFGELPDGLHFLVWELPRKYSHWYTASTIGGAVEYATKKLADADLYYGVGFSPSALGLKARCPKNRIAGTVGVWCDVDLSDPVHSKKNLPATQEEALDILSCFPEPSWTIHSGHGLQLLWLYPEPWVFDGEEERQEASELSAAWIYSIRERFRAKGYDVDSTIDLSRILRLPGTRNLKDPSSPKDVKVIAESSARYTPDDLGAYISETAMQGAETKASASAPEGSTFVLDPMGEPSMSAFVALMENDSKFAKSWGHKRRDLKDQSASSYDMSLASLAVMAGWSDQEVVNLLVAHRRKHGADLKLREDYYSRTLAAAKRTAFGDTVSSQAIEDVEQLKNDDTITEDEKRAEILNAISGALKIKITRIVRYTTDPTQYRVYSGMDNAKFKSPDEYIQQTKFRATLFGAFKRLPTTFKAEEWAKLLQLMADIMEDEDAGDEATEKGSIIGWLEGYLKDRPPVPITESFEPGYPVIIDGIIHISTKPLIQWLWTSVREKHTAQALGPMLSSIGAEQRRIHVESDYGRTTRSLWALPEGEYEWNTGYTDPLEQERQDT
jgi:hypothetical protein